MRLPVFLTCAEPWRAAGIPLSPAELAELDAIMPVGSATGAAYPAGLGPRGYLAAQAEERWAWHRKDVLAIQMEKNDGRFCRVSRA